MTEIYLKVQKTPPIKNPPDASTDNIAKIVKPDLRFRGPQIVQIHRKLEVDKFLISTLSFLVTGK